MEEKKYNNWIEEMIEREAIPKASRQDTIEDFAKKWGISSATYYYQSNKSENIKKSLRIALRSVKKAAPEVLEKLKEKAKSGNTRSIEMFLDYVLKLSKNIDLTSDGEPLVLPSELIKKNETNNTTPSTEGDS